MKKFHYLVAAILLSFGLFAWAGTVWIDYSTGQFKCDNNYRGDFKACRQGSNAWLGVDFCKERVAKICGN